MSVEDFRLSDLFYEKDIQALIAGNSAYQVGDSVGGGVIHRIKTGNIYLAGDPYPHYLCLSEDDGLLAAVNCLIPAEVVFTKQ